MSKISIHIFIEQLLYGVKMGLVKKEEAFDQIVEFNNDHGYNLPEIAKDEIAKDEIEKFIELAKYISAKYST